MTGSVAFQYANEYTENIHCYVNNINTVDGGTHLTGFRSALTRTLNSYIEREMRSRKDKAKFDEKAQFISYK